ncbi:SIR2 family protein [Herbaspirillum sp. NPDC101396]|uniref:SIR2 family protein n=1 Tax=Herbaspirillum sp. NPDC101396 TaxID=3364005 RepID=UPI00383A9379
MKWLEARFKEDLSSEENLAVSNGQVVIRSRSWTAAELIDLIGVQDENGKNLLLDEMFDDWLAEYKERQIELADDILRRFELEDRFRRLSEAHRAHNVIPFVGAGLSMPSGYPSWTRFLQKQRKQTAISEVDFEALLEQGEYEQAAQQIANAQGVAFNEAVDNTFGCTRDLHGPIEMLPYVFPDSVVTTNFDNTLDRIYQNAGRPFTEKLTGADSHQIRRQMLAECRILLMLHGKATSGRGRILTQMEYDQHYIDGVTLASTIHAICDSRNLLFLGCSLTVDRTLAAIKARVAEVGHDNLPRHYAFLEEPETEQIRIRRQAELAECHIYPIWFPAETHNESIEALLVKLQEASQ